jgi:phosphohistidine phosphatase
VVDEEVRRLVLLRHAKSAWPEDMPDHDRPLGKRGRRDAPAVGCWLRGNGYVPDTVVCSTARRTRETWELVAAELGPGFKGRAPAVTFEPRAYAASAVSLLYLARELPGQCRTGMLIAHNPGISELAGSLAGTHPGGMNFPTAGVAVLEFDGEWADLGRGQARVAGFVVPADLTRR